MEAVLWSLTHERRRPKAVSYDKNPHFYEDLAKRHKSNKGTPIEPYRFDKKLSDFYGDHIVLYILLDRKWRIFADCLDPSRTFRGVWIPRDTTIFLKGQSCQDLQVACVNGLTDCNGVLHAIDAFQNDTKSDLRLSDNQTKNRLRDGTWVDLVKYVIQLDGKPRDLRIQVVVGDPATNATDSLLDPMADKPPDEVKQVSTR